MIFKCIQYNNCILQAQIKTDWAAHTAKVSKISWAPDAGHLGSCSLDTACIVWTPGDKRKYIVLKGRFE